MIQIVTLMSKKLSHSDVFLYFKPPISLRAKREGAWIDLRANAVTYSLFKRDTQILVFANRRVFAFPDDDVELPDAVKTLLVFIEEVKNSECE